MSKRKMSYEEIAEWADTLPIIWRNRYGRRILSRAEWEQLPRGRRIRDILLFRQPPKWLT